MLIEVIEKSRQANVPIDYKKQTIRKFIGEYESLMKAESTAQTQIGQDQTSLSFSKPYRPLIKLLATNSVELRN